MDLRVIAAIGAFLLPFNAFAHHSFATAFDRDVVMELEGEIVSVAWRNPHVTFALKVSDENGEEVTWNIESHSLSIMRRMDLPTAFVQVGDRVRVAGNPARRSDLNGLFVQNVLLPSGEEWVFHVGASPADLRWSDRLMGTTAKWFATEGDVSAAERGIFRVWSTTFVSRTNGWAPRREDVLTASAREAMDAFGRLEDAPLASCAPKGMPWIMDQPYPMEFVDEGDRILVRLEEYDLVRTIHMDSASPTGDQSSSLLGHSVGHWEDDTLVVATSGVNYPYYNEAGIPLSNAASFIERISAVEDGSRLEYRITVTDPSTFVQPVVSDRTWVWLSDVKVEPYDCATEG